MIRETTVTGAALQPGDAIITDRDRLGRIRRTVPVKRLESGESCKGVHVNVFRDDRDRARILSSDGCYDNAALIDILREDGTSWMP